MPRRSQRRVPEGAPLPPGPRRARRRGRPALGRAARATPDPHPADGLSGGAGGTRRCPARPQAGAGAPVRVAEPGSRVERPWEPLMTHPRWYRCAWLRTPLARTARRGPLSLPERRGGGPLQSRPLSWWKARRFEQPAEQLSPWKRPASGLLSCRLEAKQLGRMPEKLCSGPRPATGLRTPRQHLSSRLLR